MANIADEATANAIIALTGNEWRERKRDVSTTIRKEREEGRKRKGGNIT